MLFADVLSPTSRTPHSARSDAFSPFAAVQLDAGANSGAVPQTWEAACEWVLGQRMDLWETMFEPVYLQASSLLMFAPAQAVVLVPCPQAY